MHTKTVFDPDKAASNFQKHGVLFSDAKAVLSDPLALTQEDADAEGEQRWITLRRDALNRLLVVVHLHRDDVIRMISARKATSKERRDYESGI